MTEQKIIDYVNRLLHAGLERSTCIKNPIAAVVESIDGKFSLGWNGPTEDFKKYCDKCPRYAVPSGMRMDLCPAIHAEVRAILKAYINDVDPRGGTLWITCGQPCHNCMATIVESGIVKIISPYEQRTDQVGIYNFALSFQQAYVTGIDWIKIDDLIASRRIPST